MYDRKFFRSAQNVTDVSFFVVRPINQADHLVVDIEWLTIPHRKPHPLPIKERRSQPRTRNTIYVKTWTKRLAEPGPSMDPGNVFPHRIMAIKPNIPVTY